MPLDKNITCLEDVPYTISYVIRKRQQIDNLNELTSEKRPPEIIIWDGTSEDIDRWLDRAFKTNKKDEIFVSDDEIED